MDGDEQAFLLKRYIIFHSVIYFNKYVIRSIFMDEKIYKKPHLLTLEDRKKLILCG